jgi:two-component system OmpR family response regulator
MLPGKVLLVSEDVEAGLFWAAALRRHGLDVVVVGSAGGLPQQWEEAGFDLALVDTVNRCDGLELCRRLRSGALNPILLLASECDETFWLELYRAGADECIPKPLGPAVLTAKVKAWLRQAWTVRAAALRPLERA